MLFNVDDHHLARLLSHFHHFLSAALQFFYFAEFLNNDADDGEDDEDDTNDDEGGDADGEVDGEDGNDTCMAQH